MTENGQSEKVSLNQILPTKNNAEYTGNLIIPNENIILQENITNNNNFIFKNIIVRDSTEAIFTLNSNGENFNKQIHSVAQAINLYTRAKIPDTKPCVFSTFVINEQELQDFPINSKTIQLKNVEVSKKKEELKYINDAPKNKFARAIKIDPDREHQSLLELIERNGYIVVNDPSKVIIFNRGMPKSDGRPSEPIIIIDDFNVTDLFILRHYRASEIDEIYFNKFDLSFTSARGGEIGTIRIYPRKDIQSKKTKPKGIKVNLITNGFKTKNHFQILMIAISI